MNYYILFLFLVSFSMLNAQADTVKFINPGLEGEQSMGGSSDFYLNGWIDCGDRYFIRESPPDIHPNGYWGVKKDPAEGKTYLGMVTRDNGSYEIVSAKLNSKLLAGHEYEFSVYLAMSEVYISRTRMTNKEANYYQPVVLVVYGNPFKCKNDEFLFETDPVENTEWKKYTIRIKPKNDCKYLTLAAEFIKGTLIPYNGHILIDGLSTIVKIKE